MAFLFKSKKHQDRTTTSRDGSSGSQGSIQNAPGRAVARDDKNTALQRATPTGSLHSIDNDTNTSSPDQGQVQGHGRRTGSVDTSQPSDLPFRNQPPVSNNSNASLYPWSQRRLTYTSSHPSPFPRYGAAVNSVASKEGDVYLMGGLINSSTVKGDLWMIEAGGSMTCYPLATTAEGPGPRVGHASLLVGNAFIVYGGDTKIDDNDILDETLYLLNTSTRHWSRALPAGPRPSGRYGHSLNILGSKIFIFGGQVEGFFMNDLSAFDLNQLQSPTNRWEILLKAEASPKMPAARTNHSMVTFNDKMYLFGGTNGFQWFNDVWCYDPAVNKWSQLDCIGYIPAPREGHAAALVDDVMYIFGGRTDEGTDLGDLAAFRITQRRWYTFQNMGPSPSARSGHSMTTVGKSIVVLGGEPSTASSSTNDLGILYVLDTTKIRYPNDAPGGPQRIPQARRPSDASNPNRQPPMNGGGPPEPGNMIVGGPSSINNEPATRRIVSNGMEPTGSPGLGGPGTPPPAGAPPRAPGGPPRGPPGPGGPGGPGNKMQMPRAAATASPSGPPPQGPTPAKPGPDPSAVGRVRGASVDRAPTGSPQLASAPSPITREIIPEDDAPPPTSAPMSAAGNPVNGRRTPTTPTQVSRTGSKQGSLGGNEPPRGKMRPGPGGSIDSMAEGVQRATPEGMQRPIPDGMQRPAPDGMQRGPPEGMQRGPPEGMQRGPPEGMQRGPPEGMQRPAPTRPASPPHTAKPMSANLNRRSSGRNSQTVALLKELDNARNRNAWYASELELARKGGYVPNASMGPALDGKAVESFDDEDRPLIEALLAMRTELANVQNAVDKQAIVAAKQIAEAERQRDVAIQEAVYAKAKLAAQSGGSVSSTPQPEGGEDFAARSADMSKKLASALNHQKSLQTQLEAAKSELDAEKRARKLADDTTSAAQKRMADLEAYKQQNSGEVERLKAELHFSQREAREQAVAATEAVAALELLRVEKETISRKLDEVADSSNGREETFESLRAAIEASQDASAHLETKLEEERTQREKVEGKLTKLKAEHEARTAELVAVTQRLRDAEELAEKHATEARTHREAVLSGLSKLTAKDDSVAHNGDAERAVALQNQLTAANALVKKYQQEADIAADRLRSAEERIAGLEQYQEQSSREGVGIRRQLQSALRENQGLQAAHSDIKNQLAAQQLETNAMTVQHNALKDILVERGISPTGSARTRGLTSPRTTSPEQQNRLRELEAQLASISAAHEETKQTFAIQAQDSETAYREKLSQLESDYQSAVHYVKGTEKMLKQLQEQLARYKTENGRLKSEVVELEDRLQAGPNESGSAGWENERAALQTKISSLEAELHDSAAQLEKSLEGLKAELADSQHECDEARKSLSSQRKELEQLQSENALLEQRASDAEQKVSLLLDQVEHSVDTYRRRSRHVVSMNADAMAAANGMGLGSLGTLALGHSRNESSEGESIYGDSNLGNRNSAALDNLATELETLRNHWETTNKNYRLSTNFDFESANASKKEDDTPIGMGMSGNLADWRKRLDTENHSDAGEPKQG
ncbi:Cell polarity protein (Tea1) [Trichoderma simmonsii]|uniref:Cell polarity protein (Tea1) n=3 Tax=Trichoderma simmonsii TaxID=1491479 RepID=A0A8G0PCM7_9HYPO|nr:Cell polarity protein (Tea1) [Trichoderma simmonsii]